MAAWDVTVRGSATATADIPGRVFSYYLAIFTGGNGRPVNSTYYTTSTDGLRYSVSLGIDGNGFVVYGNSAGFLDAGSTPVQPRPLYHDVLAANEGTPAQLTHLVGGVSLAPTRVPDLLRATRSRDPAGARDPADTDAADAVVGVVRGDSRRQHEQLRHGWDVQLHRRRARRLHDGDQPGRRELRSR